MATITSNIKTLDSAGQPAEGIVIWEQSSEYITADGRVTTARGELRMKAGVLVGKSGGPVVIPETPEGQIVSIEESFGGSTIFWSTRIPADPEIDYAYLERTVPPATGVGVPQWVTDLLEVPGEVVGKLELAEAAAEAAQQSRDEAAAFGGTNNAQVTTFATTAGPLKTALDGSYVTVNEDGDLEIGGVVVDGGANDADIGPLIASPTSVTGIAARELITVATENKANASAVYSKSAADAAFVPAAAAGFTPFEYSNIAVARPNFPRVEWVPAVGSEAIGAPQNIANGDRLLKRTAIPIPITYLSDTFPTDGAITPTTAGGKVWTVSGTGVPTIVAGAFGFDTITGPTYASVDPGFASKHTRIVASKTEAAWGQGYLFRYSSATNHFGLFRQSGALPNWRLGKRVGSATLVEVAGASTTPVAPVIPITDNDVIDFYEYSDNRIKVVINGVTLYDGVQTDLAANTKIAYYGSTNSAAHASAFTSILSESIV